MGQRSRASNRRPSDRRTRRSPRSTHFVSRSVGRDGAPVSPPVTYGAVMSAVFVSHYLVVTLLGFLGVS